MIDQENIDKQDVAEIFNKPAAPEETEAQKVPVETSKTLAENKEIPENIAPEEKQSKLITFILDLALNLIIVFGLVFLIQTFIASPFKVFGPSMCDTLNNLNGECHQGYGEYIIVNKLVYKDFFGWSISDPDRGDIIVFHPPGNEGEFYIKRIIGIKGDTIKLIDGKVFLFNDEYETGYELPEPYLNETNAENTLPSTNRVTTFTVPEDKFFVMGDNRVASTDSRSCFRDAFQGGCRGEEAYFLPRENIEGRAWVVLWPLSGIRLIDKADYFK
jgi:signal peptidase I